MRLSSIAFAIAGTRAFSMAMSQPDEQQAPLCRQAYEAWNDSQ
jgi:hypothetical protein